MNIVISFAGLESGHESRPFALRTLAGGTVLSHILAHFLDRSFDRLLLLVERGEEQIQRWAAQKIPNVAVETILVPEGTNLLAAAKQLQEAVRSQPLLFIAGRYIAEADFGKLASAQGAVSCLVQSEQDEIGGEELALEPDGFVVRDGERCARWAGACWFQDGALLLDALERTKTAGLPGISEVLNVLLDEGRQASTVRAVYCLDTRTKEDILYANARLLGLDHGSEDAIERSYAEDFTVLPPVFLHETAVIENSVIGPFVNLEAHATVRNSIVRNTLVSAGAQLTNVILDSSLIGENAIISGKSKILVVGDEDRLDL